MTIAGRKSGQFSDRYSLGGQPLSNLYGALQKFLRQISNEKTEPLINGVFFKQALLLAKVADGTT